MTSRTDIEASIWEDIKRKDEAIYQLGDVLDVKASIILVLVTLLVALSGQILLLRDLPVQLKWVQGVAVTGIVAAVISSVVALWPRTFDLPMPEEWITFAKGLAAEHTVESNAASIVDQKFYAAKVRLTLSRIDKNKRTTTLKSKFNRVAFYATAISLSMELITLVWLAMWHL